jgi:hypothetical protein
VRLSDAPHDCNAGTQLRVTIVFPNCWDGKTLDGAKQTNVVRLTGTTCPASHPVQIPQVVVHVAYQGWGRDPESMRRIGIVC